MNLLKNMPINITIFIHVDFLKMITNLLPSTSYFSNVVIFIVADFHSLITSCDESTELHKTLVFIPPCNDTVILEPIPVT